MPDPTILGRLSWFKEWGKLALAGAVFVGGMGGLVYGCQIERTKDAEMRVIPYTPTPNSIVRCYNRFGTLVFEDLVTDRSVEHVLTRLPCMVYYGGGCCISDPPAVGVEDTRRWGIGRTDTERVTDLDGRGIECIIIKTKP